VNSVAYKIANIENYLQGIDRDMDNLAREEEVLPFACRCGERKSKSGI
jgi:hypothetical protein